ncbi:MAG: glycoside hydrolase family 2 TIM barrel-domain containing protein [Eubacteriales bacterium]|nr:glycoside hydrolase family 2 TIM barrel-domain containing protein [Eubacteriales bacterium]
MNTPRPEYPNPVFMRKEWLNLNGEWSFSCGECKKADKIIVPFCPESVLSGVGYTGFIKKVIYSRRFEIPAEWKGRRVFIHFGAADYHAKVYINGGFAGSHKGGYTPFAFDITKFLVDGENKVTVEAEDDLFSGNQPSGKQSKRLESFGCFYTRTTGIWQTVWLEAVPKDYIVSVRIEANAEGNVRIAVNKTGEGIVKAEAFYNGESVCVIKNAGVIEMNISDIHLWDIGQGNLYDLTLTYGDDRVYSYFGLRSVSLENGDLLLNGRKVFGRWVLDQGFYPDGIYTAPDDDALKNDIIYSMQLGFNGARLHQKLFEPRFLYWADKLGYMVWDEHANWGLDISKAEAVENFLPEWLEGMERDFSHPSVIGWCPFNETWDTEGGKRQCDDVLRIVYEATKKFDNTRPVIDTSGNFHVITDIFDIHDYNQDKSQFASHYDGHIFLNFTDRQTYRGEPYFVSEYGGIKWSEGENGGWGYGDAPKTREEFLDRYSSLTHTLLANDKILGFCYTQLYDVEQEQNGLMTYDRKFKFEPEIIHKINTEKAAIE